MNCFWNRFLIDRALDDGRPLSEKVNRHLDRCPACRDHLARQQEVVGQLAKQKPPEDAAVPSPYLKSRVLSAIRSESRPASTGSLVRWSWGGLAMAGAAAVVVALAGLRPWGAGEAVNSSPTTRTAAVLLETTTRVTSGGDLLLVATNFDQPLQRELNLVIDDARTAWRSLQADLLPSQLLAKTD